MGKLIMSSLVIIIHGLLFTSLSKATQGNGTLLSQLLFQARKCVRTTLMAGGSLRDRKSLYYARESSLPITVRPEPSVGKGGPSDLG